MAKIMIANAAPWPFALKQAYIEDFPPESLWEVYGSTEMGVNCVLAPEDQMRKPGSCGKPAPLVEVKLFDEDGNEVIREIKRFSKPGCRKYRGVDDLPKVLGGLGILYVKRWAIWLSGITPLIPWVQVLIDKFSRIDQKFSAYRNGGTMDDFQSGVMTALAVIAVTGIYVMVIVHLRRSYRHLFMSEQWIRGNLLPETKGRRNLSIETAKSDVEAGDFCMMMPDMDADEPA